MSAALHAIGWMSQSSLLTRSQMEEKSPPPSLSSPPPGMSLPSSPSGPSEPAHTTPHHHPCVVLVITITINHYPSSILLIMPQISAVTNTCAVSINAAAALHYLCRINYICCCQTCGSNGVEAFWQFIVSNTCSDLGLICLCLPNCVFAQTTG